MSHFVQLPVADRKKGRRGGAWKRELLDSSERTLWEEQEMDSNSCEIPVNNYSCPDWLLDSFIGDLLRV